MSTQDTHTLETAGDTWPGTLEGLTHEHRPQLPRERSRSEAHAETHEQLLRRTRTLAKKSVICREQSLWKASQSLLTQLIFWAASAGRESVRSSRGPSGHSAGKCGHVRKTKPGAQGKTLDYPAIRVLHVACGSAFAKPGILPGPPTQSHLPEGNLY